jgi:hypothetical protein
LKNFSKKPKIQLDRYLKIEKQADRALKLDRETLKGLTGLLLLDEEKAENFLSNYKHLRRIFELLGAHPIKLEYKEEFAALTEVYYTYLHRKSQKGLRRNRGIREKILPQDFRNHTASNRYRPIQKFFPTITLDEKYLGRFEQSYPDHGERVYNMIFDLKRFIYVEKSRTPYLETIGERVNKILREIKEERIKIEEAYQKLCQIIREVNEIQQRRKELTGRKLAIILPLEKNYW